LTPGGNSTVHIYTQTVQLLYSNITKIHLLVDTLWYLCWNKVWYKGPKWHISWCWYSETSV